MGIRKGATLLRISQRPKDLTDRVEKMMTELGMSRFQVIEQAIFRYIESGCRSLMYRLEEIEERKKLAEAVRLENLRRRTGQKLNPGRRVGRPRKPRPFNGIS
jgi:energy-coupling factor transporter ATP-binding protein EcfA2